MKLINRLIEFKQRKMDVHCHIPMSKIITTNRNCLKMDLSSGKPQNSICAESFNRILFERTGIKAVGSYFYGDFGNQIKIVVWVNEDEHTESLFSNKPFCNLYCRCGIVDKYFDEVCRCMLNALKIHSIKNYQMLLELYERQLSEKEGVTHLYVTLIAFERHYLDYLYCTTALKTEKRLKAEYALSDNFKYLVCNAFGNNICGYPMFLFFDPEDLKDAVSKGYIDGMTDIAYNIISEADILHLLPPRKDFQPQLFSRIDLSSKLLDGLDDSGYAEYIGSFMPF